MPQPENLHSSAASAVRRASRSLEYRGRFAPSPTGPLHLGSLAAALASWLDARTHGGKWLIRMENIDPPRERPGAMQAQLAQLGHFGLHADEPIVYQSDRTSAYETALRQLTGEGFTYICRCSRSRLAAEASDGALPAYPGTCRRLGLSPPGAVRLRVDTGTVRFTDRACGAFAQDVAREVGDFVVRRSDGLWAYQLAVVVDDAAQGITDVVRGADLLDSTPRQIVLQRLLGLPTPRYLHVPLVRDAAGRKLSKRDGSPAVEGRDALAELESAWTQLGFAPVGAQSLPRFFDLAIEAWRGRHPLVPFGLRGTGHLKTREGDLPPEARRA